MILFPFVQSPRTKVGNEGAVFGVVGHTLKTVVVGVVGSKVLTVVNSGGG